MPTATPTTTTNTQNADVEVAPPEVVLERPPRWNPPRLWTIAGFDNRRPRAARFIVTLVRPPLVSNTTPRVACELLVPPRTALGSIGVLAFAAALAIAAVRVMGVLPLWLSIITVTAAAHSSVILVERALATIAVPSNHLRLQDVVAEQRGSGIADNVLDELLATVDRPVILDVDEDAPGVIAFYQCAGFTPTGERNPRAGTITMTRPAPTADIDPVPSVMAGIRPSWLWPTPCDLVGGLLAAAALMILHAPGTWSRLVVVAIATFVTVTAAGTDWRLHRIPTKMVAAGALPIIWIATATDNTVDALAGAALMAGPLLASHLATRGRAPGLGDVKLASLAGATLALLNPTTAPLAAIMLTLVGGSILGAIYQHRRQRRGFPLGPAIAMATVALLVAEALTLRGLL